MITEKISINFCEKNWFYPISGLRPIFRTNFISAKNSNSLKNGFINLDMFLSMPKVYILRLLKVLVTTFHLQEEKIRCYGEKTVKNNGFSPIEEKTKTKHGFIMSSKC